MSDWNPILYERFLQDRTKPSKDLASHISIQPKSVFDLGCGTGNSTNVLAQKFQNADITGGDSSETMLKKAQENYPMIKFIQFNAETDWNTLPCYDLIFSNACIQWIPEHKRLIPTMISHLNNGGQLAVQFPMQTEHPFHKLVQQIAHSDKWKSKFRTEVKYNVLTKEEYFDIISECTDNFELWQTNYCHRMPSHQSIVDWFRSTGLQPFMSQLTESEQVDFEQDILNELMTIYPVRANGELLFEFPRMFFVARK